MPGKDLLPGLALVVVEGGPSGLAEAGLLHWTMPALVKPLQAEPLQHDRRSSFSNDNPEEPADSQALPKYCTKKRDGRAAEVG